MRNITKEKQVIKKTFFTVLSFAVIVGMSHLACAEELSALEMSSKKLEAAIKDTSVKIKQHAIGLRFTPQFGFIQSADGNQILFNDFNSGFGTELTLSPNVAIEGIFRYARYNVRVKIPASTQASNQKSHVMRNPVTGDFSIGGSGYMPAVDYIGDMRQIAIGANLKYEMFPNAIMTPFFGGGMVYFDNEYYSEGFMRIGLPQHVYGANILSGMKLRLSKALALVGRAEAGTLLNNKNGNKLWRKNGSSLHSRNSFRSFDQYYTLMAGVSFGI